MTNSCIHAGGTRTTKVPLTERVVATRPPGGPALSTDAAGDPRAQLADWMTTPDNPWFARLAVNRCGSTTSAAGWSSRKTTCAPPTRRPTNRCSTTWRSTLVENRLRPEGGHAADPQLARLSTVERAERDEPGRRAVSSRTTASRRLPAEVLLDAICAVTDVPESFPGRPRGTRAIELWDNRVPSYFLDIFGRSERLSPCECGRSSEPTMAQCLHLMNAPEIEREDRRPKPAASRDCSPRRKRPTRSSRNCAWRRFGRPPGENEKTAARKLFATGFTRGSRAGLPVGAAEFARLLVFTIEDRRGGLRDEHRSATASIDGGFLRLGSVGGLALAQFLHLQSAHGSPSAKTKDVNCIFIFILGGMPHHDMWDYKPDAPAEIRGDFKPIKTNVPGHRLDRSAAAHGQGHRQLAILRSLTHGDSDHGRGYHIMMTGNTPGPGDFNSTKNNNVHPSLGSMVARMTDAGAVAAAVHLRAVLPAQRRAGVSRAELRPVRDRGRPRRAGVRRPRHRACPKASARDRADPPAGRAARDQPARTRRRDAGRDVRALDTFYEKAFRLMTSASGEGSVRPAPREAGDCAKRTA